MERYDIRAVRKLAVFAPEIWLGYFAELSIFSSVLSYAIGSEIPIKPRFRC